MLYQTKLSASSRKAGSLNDADMGLLASTSLDPILCTGALIDVATYVGRAVTSAVQNAVQQGDNTQETNTECTDAAFDFATSALYLPPSRMTAGRTPVSDNASVEELISTTRGRSAA